MGSVANKAGRQKNLHRLPSTAINWMSDFRPLISAMRSSTSQDSGRRSVYESMERHFVTVPMSKGGSGTRLGLHYMKSENIVRTWPIEGIVHTEKLGLLVLTNDQLPVSSHVCERCQFAAPSAISSGVSSQYLPESGIATSTGVLATVRVRVGEFESPTSTTASIQYTNTNVSMGHGRPWWVGHRSSRPRGLSPLWYDFKFTLTDCLASQAFPPCPHCPLHHWRTQAQTVIWRSLTISLLLAAFRIPFLHQLLPQSAEPLPGYLLLSSHYSVGNGDVGTEVRPENSLVTAESWPEE